MSFFKTNASQNNKNLHVPQNAIQFKFKSNVFRNYYKNKIPHKTLPVLYQRHVILNNIQIKQKLPVE